MAQDDPHFHWVVVIDDGLPDDIREKLDDVLRPFGRRASLCKQPPGTSKTLIEVARRQLHLNGDEPLLTGRLDDDDAWATGMVRAARDHARSWLKRPNRTPGVTFTFQDGLEWIMYEMIDIDLLLSTGERLTHPPAIRSYSLPFIGTSVFVCAPLSTGATSMSGAHSRIAERLAETCGFSIEILPTKKPMWLCCRHKQAGSGIRKAKGHEVDLTLAELAGQFGLDETRTQHYLDHTEEHQYTLLKAPLDKKSALIGEHWRLTERLNDASLLTEDRSRLERQRASLVTEMSRLERDVLGDPDSLQAGCD